MGHISVSGQDGSIAALSKLNVGRKIYVHINNSNPILDENSEARKAVDAAGWEVGFDGMEVRL
jgi:pyrroloquinoline quinone biosynthesis protein B